MNIAYFITGLGLGGAEVVTIGIANNMVERGHRVMLVYLGGENEHSAIINPNVEVFGLRMSKTPWSMICALNRAKRVLKKFNPDVVHSNMVHANIFVRLLRLFKKIPFLISSEHNKNIEGELRMKLYKWTNRLSDIETNVSQEAVDYFVEKGAFQRNKSYAMYNGIDLSRFTKNEQKGAKIRNKYAIAEDEFLFINVGRLTKAKDQQNLLAAFDKVGQGRLIIVGKGELENELRAKCSERVILAGAHSNVEDYYSASDCFVLSSEWEGFGIVIAEAMSCSLPVITTDAGGCSEVIYDRNYVVSIKNSDELARKMSQIINMSKKERSELGTKNCVLAKRFDINKICDKWEQLYHRKRHCS